MKGWIWPLLTGVIGLLAGLFVGGGAGGLVGSGVGALSGAHLGVCKAVMVAADKGIVDEATADRIATETFAQIKAVAPELITTEATNLATCRTQKGMDMLAG